MKKSGLFPPFHKEAPGMQLELEPPRSSVQLHSFHAPTEQRLAYIFASTGSHTNHLSINLQRYLLSDGLLIGPFIAY